MVQDTKEVTFEQVFQLAQRLRAVEQARLVARLSKKGAFTLWPLIG